MELWERQKNEGSKPFHAFTVYRDLGPDRSIRKVLNTGQIKTTERQLEIWSSSFSWVDRVMAYDDYLDSIKRKEKEQAIIDMSERHAKLAVAFQQKVAQRLSKLDASELSPVDLSRWLDVSTKLERISRGEPTEINREEVLIVDDIK